jgi:hypothetical protein
VLLTVITTIKILQPAAFGFVRSPRVDQLLTGRPYRLTKLMGHVVLQPGSESDGPKGVLATSRIYYWTRLNQKITSSDLTLRETFLPTYDRSSSVHGL